MTGMGLAGADAETGRGAKKPQNRGASTCDFSIFACSSILYALMVVVGSIDVCYDRWDSLNRFIFI